MWVDYPQTLCVAPVAWAQAPLARGLTIGGGGAWHGCADKLGKILSSEGWVWPLTPARPVGRGSAAHIVASRRRLPHLPRLVYT